mgnify:CR=1 FL=1
MWWVVAGLLSVLMAGAVEAVEPHDEVAIVRTSQNVGGVTQTDTTLLTAPSGTRLVLMGCTVCTGAAVDVEVEESDADVFFLESLNGCATVGNGRTPVFVSGTTAGVLTWSTGAATTTSINCWGYDFIP